MGLTFRLGQIPLAILTDTSNNVGIGAAPSGTYKLEVTGTAKVSSTLLVSGASTLSSTLQVGGTTSSTVTIGDAVGSATDSNIRLRTGSTKYAWLIASQNNVAGFEITPSTAVGGTTFSTPALTILPAGNVGIGTSSPSSILHAYRNVASDINFTIENGSTAGYTAQIKLVSAVDSGAGYHGIGSYTSGGNTHWLIGGGATTNTMVFYTNNNTERMRITSGGNVGIGRTNPSNKLDVINSGASQGTSLFATDNATFNSIQVYAAGADGYNGAATVMIMGRNTTTSRSINAGGTINASGADYAEYMIKNNINDIINKGDIVGVDINGLLSNIFADSVSFVVKSTDPSYVGGDTWCSVDNIGKISNDSTDEEKAEYQAKIEEARAKVDRIAFSGQVPCNVYNANVGDYIIPIDDNGTIKGQAITNPTFEQYQLSVGKVWKIMEDGRAWIAVKIG